MTNPSSSIEKGVCRRSLLKSVPMIAGAIISTNVVAQNLFAQAKLTHDAAKYQDHPNNGQQCSNCVQFVAPASCKVVPPTRGMSCRWRFRRMSNLRQLARRSSWP